MQKTADFAASSTSCEGSKSLLVAMRATTAETERAQTVCSQPERVSLESFALFCN